MPTQSTIPFPSVPNKITFPDKVIGDYLLADEVTEIKIKFNALIDYAIALQNLLPKNQAPQVSFNRANSAYVQDGDTVQLNTYAYDFGGYPTKYEMYQDNTLIATYTESNIQNNSTWYYTTNALSAGNYTFYVKVYDNAGGITQSDVITITSNTNNQLVIEAQSEAVNQGENLMLNLTITGQSNYDFLLYLVDGTDYANSFSSPTSLVQAVVLNGISLGSHTLVAKAFINTQQGQTEIVSNMINFTIG